jgi:hypothetical protein
MYVVLRGSTSKRTLVIDMATLSAPSTWMVIRATNGPLNVGECFDSEI